MASPRCPMTVLLVLGSLVPSISPASEFRQGRLTSDLVPRPVDYSILLPDGYEANGVDHFPLVLFLHGGGLDHKDLANWRQSFDDLWSRGQLSKMVAVMPGVGEPTIEGRVRFMDFKNGSEKWESFLVGPFLEHVRNRYNVRRERESTVVAGFSDGGFGALRLGMKYPDKFCAVAAFEPAIMPAVEWKSVLERNRFFISDALMERFYGNPVDEEYWAMNNPASIAQRNAASIRDSGLAFYIECGDQDFLNLHEGTEFLHRVLQRNGIRHEYHLVLGADHAGRTLTPRCMEGLRFLDRAVNSPGPDRDPVLQEIHRLWRGRKDAAENATRR